MSSISSITKAVSGLNSARKGLQVTAHNLSNVNTEGYTRQHLLQSESRYLTIAKNDVSSMQVGLGVSCDEIRQIRDDLADRRLRSETSVLNYYQKLNATVSDIEIAFDEPYGDTINEMMNKFWSQAHKLGTAPNLAETRQSFISAAKVLADKITSVSKALEDCQDNINTQVITSVDRINKIVDEIRDYNIEIAKAESGDDKANDYRDERNKLLDELATYGDISYYENANSQVQVSFEGHVVVDKMFAVHMKLDQAEEKSPFVNPVWEDTRSEVFRLNNIISTANENDTGSLRALLVARGNGYVNDKTSWDSLAFNDSFSVDTLGNSFIIPTMQKKLDAFANQLAEIVNSSLDGEGIGTYKGKDGVPVFVTSDGTGVITAKNISVNTTLTDNGGYNALGTVNNTPENDDNKDNVSDSSKITEMLEKWQEKVEWFADDTMVSRPNSVIADVNTFYNNLITDLGVQGSNYTAKTTEKTTSVNNVENQRLAMGAVSQDEEFSYMLKYQYAYNASARMITMLDGMLDTIINKM